ncbi:MAG: flavodoxin [Planctomycetota bacterium]
MKLAIVWSTTTGNTEEAAEALKAHLGDLVTSYIHVDDVTIEEMQSHDVVLVGVSTWDIGELQADFDVRLKEFADADWSGVTFGFFGGGDAVNYPDTFVDAFGILWEAFSVKGARLIGKVPVDDYDFEDSRALCDDRKSFLGLPFDDDNEPEKTAGRVEAWAAQIRSELAGVRVSA